MRYKTWWQVWENGELEKECEDEKAAHDRRQIILHNRPMSIVKIVGLEREASECHGFSRQRSINQMNAKLMRSLDQFRLPIPRSLALGHPVQGVRCKPF
jgi:hypothetical protein